ncbi:HAMP domain-containing sensor histidine kinase [Domibacillus sp. A3M-37]|uniref:sensor histidine kinase n=1 Tax=Domibacillus sp. A3M-37 TaxID=2962037 RepID=UPI0020B86E51|nr:HAMP domain-containing sensor histidine kinase [Domibacillus sp. A3M-37]
MLSNKTRRISLLRYWTTRYAVTLAVGLLVLAMLSVVWIRHTTLENRLDVSEFLAAELAGRIAGSQQNVEDTTQSTYLDQDMLDARDELMKMESPPSIFITDAGGTILSAGDQDLYKESSFPSAVLEKKSSVQTFSGLNNDALVYLIKKPIIVDEVTFGWVVMLQPEDEFADLNDEYRLLALFILGSGLLGWAAIYILSRRLARPISAAAAAAKEIRNGNYGVSLMPSKAKEQEVYDLVISFNDMAIRLEQLESIRAELLAGVTHELKTPVTSISGLLQAVKDDVVTGEEAKEFITISLKETERMQTMINDLLEFNTFAANALPVSTAPHELNELTRGIVHEWNLARNSDDIPVHFHPYERDLIVLTDPNRFRQIMMNLLNNAAHAIESKGQMAVTVRNEDPCALIDVSDTGIGIPESEKTLIFERFYRGENKKYKIRGLGLGLPFSQLLARAMDGDLELKETSPLGTTFTLKIKKQD